MFLNTKRFNCMLKEHNLSSPWEPNPRQPIPSKMLGSKGKEFCGHLWAERTHEKHKRNKIRLLSDWQQPSIPGKKLPSCNYLLKIDSQGKKTWATAFLAIKTVIDMHKYGERSPHETFQKNPTDNEIQKTKWLNRHPHRLVISIKHKVTYETKMKGPGREDSVM